MADKTEKKPSAAVLKYATTVARINLGEGMPEIELREHGALTVSYYGGKPYAAYWFDGAEIVFRFRRPDDDTLRAERSQFYRELAVPAGWLEYRRELSRDPKPDLESKVGQVMGKSFFEMTHGQQALTELTVEQIQASAKVGVNEQTPTKVTLASITSRGGPYIALPRSALASYGGFEDEALNEAIFRAARDEGSLTELKIGPALLLGTPDRLYWFPSAGGGQLVRISSFDADDDALLARTIAHVDDKDWTPIAGRLQVEEAWVVFDSALAGSAALAEGLELGLHPGSYSLASRTLRGEGFEFLLVRLERS